MALLDLKNKLFCNKKVGESNFTAAKALSVLQSKFKIPALDSITALISAKVGAAVGKVASKATSLIQNAKDSLKADFETLEGEYDSIASQQEEIKGQTGALFSSCPAAINNNPSAPTVNTVADTLSSPSTNDDTITETSTDTKLKKDTENSKSQGISKTSDNITAINNKMSTMGILEQRTYVKQFSNPHPVLANYTSQLSYFQPISQTIGESYFGATRDKPSLQLEYWSFASCIRASTAYKIRGEIIEEIHTSYVNLNRKFVSNISNEFFTERKKTAPYNTSHAYHIAGDSAFVESNLKIGSILMKALGIVLATSLGDQINLINYLAPITQKIKIENDLYKVKNESNTTIINKRNDIVRKPFTTVNNKTLKPKALAED